jgi:hypothetical protein
MTVGIGRSAILWLESRLTQVEFMDLKSHFIHMKTDMGIAKFAFSGMKKPKAFQNYSQKKKIRYIFVEGYSDQIDWQGARRLKHKMKIQIKVCYLFLVGSFSQITTQHSI